MPTFAPDPTPEERERVKKFGGYIRGMWHEPVSCRFPFMRWLFAPSCPKNPFSLSAHFCQEHLGHKDSGFPHICKCGYTWMDKELRRTRRRLRREARNR